MDCPQQQDPNGCRHYYIVRMYQDRERAPQRRVIKSGLTLSEAQAWCQDPETSSRTATSSRAQARTRAYGPWFDGYDHTR